MIDRTHAIACLLLTCAALTGCQDAADGRGAADAEQTVAAGAKTAAVDDASPGKPTAPVSIRYEIIGNAMVGQPIGINLQVSSSRPDQVVRLNYRVNDASAMLFPESQAQRIEMAPATDAKPRMQQVTVIPQREGRLFLNVSAEVETENGTMFRALAIPIQVGAGNSAPATNGEVRQSGDGEKVISMPASESGEN
jgi:hypothetical protein